MSADIGGRAATQPLSRSTEEYDEACGRLRRLLLARLLEALSQQEPPSAPVLGAALRFLKEAAPAGPSPRTAEDSVAAFLALAPPGDFRFDARRDADRDDDPAAAQEDLVEAPEPEA